MVYVVKPDKIRAFIFDLDGVLTDTEKLHIAAWKRMFDEFLRKRSHDDGGPFKPFTPPDYLKYVDGKPRYDGARDFLASRHISLEEGSERDPPDRETVRGLGNRKNHYYLELLDKKGPKVYKTSAGFIKAIRARGLKTAVISSSENCAKILRVTGTESLFDARVDGIDLKKLGIPGKPDPAMFLEAAKRIKVRPDEAAIVEDALAGVEAGAHGRFALVVGVARSKNARGLKEHGARVVVSDLKELRLADGAGRLGRHERTRGESASAGRSEKKPKEEEGLIPSALGDNSVDERVRRSKRLALFLDYDGTLAEIVQDPSKAFISKETRDVLRSLAHECTLCILSGRDVQAVRRFVGLEGTVYAGSHGFDIIMADGKRLDNPRWDAFLPSLDAAEKELHRLLKGIPGAFAERKRFAIAVHYRMVDPARVKDVKRRFDSVASSFSSSLRRSAGKKVFELLPDVAWDKGMALLFLLKFLKLDGRSEGTAALPVFIGDDLTDEDAFRALRTRGLGILVKGERGRGPKRGTLARYSLRDPKEVKLFLERVAGMLQEKVPGA